MDGVIRYLAVDVLKESTNKSRAGFDPGFWVKAADFDERQAQGKQREVALQDRLTVVEQQNAELIELLHAVSSPVVDGELLTLERSKARANARTYLAALNPNPEGHYSDCATNNRGVPELLGPCDCGYEGKQK